MSFIGGDVVIREAGGGGEGRGGVKEVREGANVLVLGYVRIMLKGKEIAEGPVQEDGLKEGGGGRQHDRARSARHAEQVSAWLVKLLLPRDVSIGIPWR